ncbi:MAG TPA: phosphotransferase family protein [Candidatus Hydrogenedentes bacterium]|nr:phosphotransferase family protein [Candidatus Hydrogenedentota bacterium]
MDLSIDEPKSVRAGEELDCAALTTYLKDTIPGLEGALTVQQFPSGFSNLTYLIKIGERELVLRRPPFGSKVKAAHDMGREFRVLSALHPVYPAAPSPLAYCTDAGVLGANFYVMERIRGIILRGKKPPDFAWPPELTRRCCESLVDNLVRLHQLDVDAIGLSDLRREGSFVRRAVDGWTGRYTGSQTDDIPDFDRAAEYLKSHCPEDVASVFIHNDYKFDNLVLEPQDPTHILGVLDWEMSTIGDPLMDLGVVLSYWNQPEDPSLGMVPCFLTLEPGCMTRREVAQAYAARTGRDIAQLGFYYAFGLIKLAVIAQQIYYRYKQGLTKDQRFAPLIFVVGALSSMAVRVIDTDEV